MFIVDVLDHVGRVSSRWSSLREAMETRARRYAAVQERLVGHQPHLAEPYISTGSLYLCTVAFLPLERSLLGGPAGRADLPPHVVGPGPGRRSRPGGVESLQGTAR